tara:strand:+ start:103 stop:390 length:288 start_codon:yes stop_codon:yes gene_type:complete
MEQKLKFISMSNDKPLDSRTINLFNSLRDMRKKHREENFQDWLQKYNDDNVPNVNFIKWFIDEMRSILKHYNYEITDEKIFKDEIASFIYNLSEH